MQYPIRLVRFLVVVVSCCTTTTVSHALVQLRFKPLIGGPTWLPLHVACVVEQNHTWDFLPKEPTSQQTLQSLLLFRSVPGEIRYISNGTTSLSSHKIHQAHTFVQSYTNRNLHLITNNCWTFALMLYWHLQTKDTDTHNHDTF